MSSFPIVVPESAPPAVHVPVAKATEVAMRAPAPRGATGGAPVGPPREDVDDGNDEVFKRKRGAFAKDCTFSASHRRVASRRIVRVCVCARAHACLVGVVAWVADERTSRGGAGSRTRARRRLRAVRCA